MTVVFEDLVDRNEIAHLLGVGPTAVSNYVARTSDKHPPFPEAVITRSKGRFRLWNIADVVQWHEQAFPDRNVLLNKNIGEELRKLRGDG
jgi:hypothetical protein